MNKVCMSNIIFDLLVIFTPLAAKQPSIQPGPRILSRVNEYYDSIPFHHLKTNQSGMSSNPIDHFDTTLHDPSHNVPMDAPPSTSEYASLDSILDKIQDKTMLFNLDGIDDVNRPLPLQATLKYLASIQTIIEQIQGASFNDKEKQWTDDEFDAFLHPLHEQICLDDPQLCLSLLIYMALSAHSSEASYTMVHRNIEECYPDSTMLFFVQVQNQLKSISGILLLHFNMCTNSCMAFTGPFLELKKCLFCSEDCF